VTRLTETRETFPWLDWLRFAAAFMVLMTHARTTSFVAYGELATSNRGLLAQLFYAATKGGHEAVIIFFVLSGFLVGGKLIERVSAGTFNALDYAVDRATRLYVPLVPALLLTIGTAWIVSGRVHWPPIMGSAAFLQGIFVNSPGLNTALWTLSYEFWFYLVGGLAATAIITRNTWWLLFAGVGLLAFTFLSPNYLIAWLVGALAYCARPATFSRWHLGATVALTMVAILMSFAAATSEPVLWAPPKGTAILFLAVAVAMLIQQLAGARQASVSAFDRLGGSLAAFSYSLYLTHFPILHLLALAGPGPSPDFGPLGVGLFAAKLAVCLSAAWVIYHLSERHTDAIRRSVKSRLAPTTKHRVETPAHAPESV
jgi:peptidoglycan/LPS O-acetylase OafA/YrhL